MLAAVAALGPTLKTRADLAERIRGMEDNQAAFARELERLTPELGIEPGQQSRLDLAQAVVDRVEEACRAAEDKRRLQSALVAAQDRQRQVEGDALVHARRVGEMTKFMQVGSLIELAGRLRDAEQKADLERQAAQAEREILAALHVENAADAQALLAAQGESELEFEQATLTAQLEDLDKHTREPVRRQQTGGRSHRGGGRRRRSGQDRGAPPYEAAGDRGQGTALFAAPRRDRGSRPGIAAYRDQHRSSMMTQASDAFRIISRGAYRGLGTQPDRDGDILVALGADGGSKLATDLSKGTRFQLYVALRAAGYHDSPSCGRPCRSSPMTLWKRSTTSAPRRRCAYSRKWHGSDR